MDGGGIFRDIPFERYADDAILHCQTQEEAERLREAIIERLAECGLELNLQKTKIVYCKDDDRRGNHEHEKFTFLGYEFRPRRAKNYRGKYFVSFLPAVSDKAAKKIRQEMQGLETPPAERQDPHRPGADVQSHHSRMGAVLRTLLSFDASSGIPAPGPNAGSVGLPEI